MTAGLAKMLRTIRFDETDPRVFALAADAGEWAVPGGFSFAGLKPGALTGKTRQAFANGFLGLASFGYSTFATVGEITALEAVALEAAFANHLLTAYGAPSHDAALEAARDEIAFARNLCEDQPINTVFTLRRVMSETGDMKEEFRTIAPPSGEAPHARMWKIEPEPDDRGAGDGA
jgi:hypothetical protein